MQYSVTLSSIITIIIIVLVYFIGDLRGPKDKKISRTRSKVKNSDDDSSPKGGQKKVKMQT